MRRAQSVAEYAVVVGLVAAVLVTMLVYIKRGVQARIRDSMIRYRPVEPYGSSNIKLTGGLYEPDYATSNMRTRSSTKTRVITNYDGSVNRRIIGGDVTRKTGEQVILPP